ncbi:MAG: membrane-bound PQQ-dependent dehydrogenase, glucose/quinate/shikimate family [Lysobacteraceae bacterium]
MNDHLRANAATRITGWIVALLGLALGAGGAWLVARGGSPYYLAGGLAVLASGALLARGSRLAWWLFALFLLATLLWSIEEVGFDWWQLLPRMDVWFVVGVWMLLPWIGRRFDPARADAVLPAPTERIALGAVLVLMLAVSAYALSRKPHDLAGRFDEARMALAPRDDAPGVAPGLWPAYGRSTYGNRYSPAAQINRGNVGTLELAWTYHTRDLQGPGDPGEFAAEVTPLAANGLLYLCTPHNLVIALDPDTGKEKWRFDPHINRNARNYQHMICRGVSYYDANGYAWLDGAATTTPATPIATASGRDGGGARTGPHPSVASPAQREGARADGGVSHADAVAQCPRRIYAPTADATLVAINADTGQPCTFFGHDGVVDLKQNHGRVIPGYLNPTSPPLVTRRVLIAGASVTDNASTDEPSGVIMGFDIDSGALLWNFDSGNPTETAPLPPGHHYVRNSPNSWSVAAADERLGLAYFPMGNQTPDIWGGNRIPAGERFNSAIVALEIATGRLRWVYQTVHHDLWDMDIGGQPSLVDLDTAQGKVPALVASSKRGDLYVLDRRDGRLLVPAPEQPVPQGAAPGDRVSPTQPFSTLSFKPERPLREADMWGTTPFDQLVCRGIFRGYRYDGIFTPPSLQGSIVYPGNYGVFDWGGVAIDPARQLLIGNPNYFAFVSKLYPRSQVDPESKRGGELGLQPMAGTPFSVDLHPLLSPLGFPCQAPPWGYMAAVDLRTMRKVWMHRNGTVRDRAPIPVPLPLGVPSLGGPLVTGGGLAFLGSALDYWLRAYDVATGEVLWKGRLPAGGQATPMTFVSPRSGRQYVVVMAGGHGSLGTKMGDALMAYALPAAAPARP